MTWATGSQLFYDSPPVARDRCKMKKSSVRIRWSTLSGVLGLALVALAQGAETNPSPRLYRSKVEPHWFADNQRFWYRNDLRGGAREFIVVDAEHGQRGPAFDHEAVARQIGGGATATKLPFAELNFSPDGATVKLAGAGKSWVLDLKSGKEHVLWKRIGTTK